ncbi:MAG TPA: CheR family methyltransferase, partial [Patescibacteria group bacterium]|nr:CheR family methyltransferase [Patescibacteria group bacterium]
MHPLQTGSNSKTMPTGFIPPAVMSESTFRELREVIYKQSGIYFTDSKKYLLEGRIAKRLGMLGMKNFEQYIDLLKHPFHAKNESKELYNAITINETYFFRSEAQFEALIEVLLPEIMKGKSGVSKTVKIWSAASSSGEEAYTISMLLLEKVKPLYPNVQFEIWGSDISDHVLESARRAVYREYAVKNMPQHYLTKYFKKQGDLYELNEEVKRMVKFVNLNLYDNTALRSMRNFDVVFCCNVLIYFDLPSKQQVVGQLYDALNKN